MEKMDYKSLILKELDEGPASIGTLKKKCEQGNKITNLRKAFHRLFKEGVIEVSGYDDNARSFKLDNMILKKVDSELNNPLYVKGLLDNPFDNNNYSKIRKIFRERVEKVNQSYTSELQTIQENIECITLKDAIKDGKLDPKEAYHHDPLFNEKGEVIGDNPQTYGMLLEKYPDAKIWYLKNELNSKIGLTSRNERRKIPIGYHAHLQREDKSRNWNFIQKYEKVFSYLPITRPHEEWLFKFFVINALKSNGDEKDGKLWDLAVLLTQNLNLFVDELSVINFAGEIESQNDNKLGRFLF
jgi:hypothetical protein